MMNNHDYSKTWETYASAWKAESADEKRALLAKSVSPQSTYTDPLTSLDGHEALVAYMLDFHQMIPGGHFVTTQFHQHHEQSAAQWEMRDGTGQVHGHGLSFGRYNADGKLISETGFFDVPEGA